ncbi:MAG: YifB family Mg chelatase-like AAA ATPase [Actinomycetota bacterium]|nr:YifB family Mg chelatase-like AAA ATPase [Actinomycetota bacterium]
MPLARALSVALVGVEGHLVEVEADLAQGLPGLTLIGLPDASLHEARDRVRAAVVNSGESWPQRRITLGLSPASLPKRGSGFDLAMAAAILAAAAALPLRALAGLLLLGELGLDGRVRPVRGVLPAVLAAAATGVERAVVPQANLAEARLVPGISVVGVGSLRALVALLRGQLPPQVEEDDAGPVSAVSTDRGSGVLSLGLDLGDIVGQAHGRWAVEVAAAGGHHLYLWGPPGAGKTMLAERLPGLLPALDMDAALEVTAVHSVAGSLPGAGPLITRPPYRDPHHTASVSALVGGGSGLARPGEVSLAHRGVLFLDEAPEFHGGVLDALRQPLERGEVTIARSGGTARFPARFLLVLAANPCPCAQVSGAADRCTCSALARRRYLSRLSGPLLDRIDLHVELFQVSRAELLCDRSSVEGSAAVADRVLAARGRARARLAGTPWRTNAELPGRELRARWAPQAGALRQAEAALERGQLSARGLDRVLRVAWTLADLAGRGRPAAADVDGALFLRLTAAA